MNNKILIIDIPTNASGNAPITFDMRMRFVNAVGIVESSSPDPYYTLIFLQKDNHEVLSCSDFRELIAVFSDGFGSIHNGMFIDIPRNTYYLSAFSISPKFFRVGYEIV